MGVLKLFYGRGKIILWAWSNYFMGVVKLFYEHDQIMLPA
jgi:hypothetical protein